MADMAKDPTPEQEKEEEAKMAEYRKRIFDPVIDGWLAGETRLVMTALTMVLTRSIATLGMKDDDIDALFAMCKQSIVDNRDELNSTFILLINERKWRERK